MQKPKWNKISNKLTVRPISKFMLLTHTQKKKKTIYIATILTWVEEIL